MKKTKFLLTALVFFSVIGIILAFKARSADRVYIDTNADGISDSFITGCALVSCSWPFAFATEATNTLNVAVVQTCAINTSN